MTHASRPRHIGETHVDEWLDLSGETWIDCNFDGCVLRLEPETGSVMVGCNINFCDLVGGGWPAEVVTATRTINGLGTRK